MKINFNEGGLLFTFYHSPELTRLWFDTLIGTGIELTYINKKLALRKTPQLAIWKHFFA